jgi:Nuclear pore protein 84 / 107
MKSFNVDDEETSAAYASVAARLESWTSPDVGKMSSKNWRTYEEDAVQWMEISMGQDDHLQETPQKRSAEENSPDTPVTSNSKKQDRSVSPFNLMDMTSFPPLDESSGIAKEEYRLYHDALLVYFRAKKSMHHATKLISSSENEEDLSLDVDYLRSLSVDNIMWSLLAKLRALGKDALWLDDSPTAKRQQQISLSDTINRLSQSSPSTTHAQLFRNLYGETSALLLQRRKVLIEWIQACYEASHDPKLPAVSSGVMWPDSTRELESNRMRKSGKIDSLHPDAPYLINERGDPLFGKDRQRDFDLTNACLGFLLAGRIDKAAKLCQTHGQPWRAAIWEGGRPMDRKWMPSDQTQSMVMMSEGNPDRIHWKNQCRKLAEVTHGPEAAIYAILAHDVGKALASPHLRSWEMGLQVCLTSMTGRIEDDLLHRYNTNLRKAGHTLIGSDCMEQEMEHLLATSTIASWNEDAIFETLEASPFTEMRTKSLTQRVIVSFIKGKTAVCQFLSTSWIEEADETMLRLMSHVLLYLESLSSCLSSDLSSIRNNAILQYLRHLSTRRELSQYMTLYAFMLPMPTLMSVFPNLLINIEAPEERSVIWRQIKELFEPATGLSILRKVVQITLQDIDSNDVRKCMAIGWLCLAPEHYGSALEFSNQLVRRLLIEDKVHVASQFLWDYFPTVVQQDENEVELSRAKNEHTALLIYLEGSHAFDRWKECMQHYFPESERSNLLASKSLNAQEKGIAQQMERRRLIESKREAANKIIDAANTAQLKLEAILNYEGGWLKEYEQDDDSSIDQEKRQTEIETLQMRLIPQVVFQAHNVYTETAMWMKAMLDDAIPIVGTNRSEVLQALDQVETISPYSPLFWLKYAHSLANVVASEEYGVFDAFGKDDLQHFMNLMEDVTIKILEERAINKKGFDPKHK